MKGWRLGIGSALLLAVVLPLLYPFVEISGWRPLALEWSELPRLGLLSVQSLLLVAGTLALALPFGVLLAILLFRTDLPLRQPVLFATILLLFIPVPVQVSAWQGL